MVWDCDNEEDWVKKSVKKDSLKLKQITVKYLAERSTTISKVH